MRDDPQQRVIGQCPRRGTAISPVVVRACIGLLYTLVVAGEVRNRCQWCRTRPGGGEMLAGWETQTVRQRRDQAVRPEASRASGPWIIEEMRSESKRASSASQVPINTKCCMTVSIRTNSSWMTPRVTASIYTKDTSRSQT